MNRTDVKKEFEGVVVIFPQLRPKYEVNSRSVKECNRISIFCKELGVVKSHGIDRSQIGFWKRFHVECSTFENVKTYKALAFQHMKTRAKFETIFNISQEKSMYFSENGMIGDVQKHYIYIWHCYLGPVIHFAGNGEDFTKMYSSLQPVKFEATAFMDNRFAAFVANRVSTEIRDCRFKNLHFCYGAQVSIEHGNHYIAECRNGDRVVLLAPDRSLLTQSDEIKEGTLLKIAYYRIYVNSKHIFISFFLTMDEFYDGVKVFEDLHRLRSYQYDILNDEFQSAQSKCMDDFNKLYDIYKKYINPWDPDKEVDFSWYGNDNDNITENSPEVSSSAEDSDPSVFFRSEQCVTHCNRVFPENETEEFELSFNLPASTGDFGKNVHLSSSSTSDINGLSSSPPEIQLSNDESDDFNIEGVSTISFGEKNTLISSNDEIRAIPSPSISSPLKPPVYNNCSLSVIGTHSTGALSMLSTPDASVEEPSLFKSTCISICNEKEAQIDFDVPSCSVAEDNVEPSNLTIPEVQHLPVLGMSKDQCLTNDVSKQQSLGNILWSNPNNSDRIQKMTLRQKIVPNNYARKVKSSSEMNQDTFQQDSEKQSFMSAEPRTVIAHKPRVSVFDITRNVTRNVESVYQRIDKAMEHCDSCESLYTRLLLRLIADKQEVRQQIGKVNSSLHQIFVNVVWNEFCSYVLTDDVVKQSGLSEEEDSRIDTNDLPTGVALRLVLEYRILSTLNNMGILQSLIGLDGFELLNDVPMLLGKD